MKMEICSIALNVFMNGQKRNNQKWQSKTKECEMLTAIYSVNGDSITIIKDLKLKGSSTTLKSGTKIKNIRLIEGDHNIDCKIDGIGGLQLKSEFVKKVTP
jgi:alkylphosphonate utilization operon protein PhnA